MPRGRLSRGGPYVIGDPPKPPPRPPPRPPPAHQKAAVGSGSSLQVIVKMPRQRCLPCHHQPKPQEARTTHLRRRGPRRSRPCHALPGRRHTRPVLSRACPRRSRPCHARPEGQHRTHPALGQAGPGRSRPCHGLPEGQHRSHHVLGRGPPFHAHLQGRRDSQVAACELSLQ